MATGSANVSSAATEKKLTDLVFYAIDKASPYALAQHPETDTLSKIEKYPLVALAITEQGIAIMWLWINAHCQPEAKPVSPAAAMKCETVADVRDAVLKNMV